MEAENTQPNAGAAYWGMNRKLLDPVPPAPILLLVEDLVVKSPVDLIV